MYKPKTIARAVAKMRERINHYKSIPAKYLNISISTGNKKIGRVMNVSIAPIITCGNCCKECAGYCYDIKAVMAYPSALNARAKNTALLLMDRDLYFQQIITAIKRRRKNLYFRWHVAGEIIDINYFGRMVDVARMFPAFLFWTYTKNYDVVNTYIDEYGPLPCNLKVMFSKWDGRPMNNPHNLPVFACKLKDGNKDTDFDFDHAMQCPGNCDICKARHIGCVAGMNTYANEH